MLMLFAHWGLLFRRRLIFSIFAKYRQWNELFSYYNMLQVSTPGAFRCVSRASRHQPRTHARLDPRTLRRVERTEQYRSVSRIGAAESSFAVGWRCVERQVDHPVDDRRLARHQREAKGAGAHA